MTLRGLTVVASGLVGIGVMGLGGCQHAAPPPEWPIFPQRTIAQFPSWNFEVRVEKTRYGGSRVTVINSGKDYVFDLPNVTEVNTDTAFLEKRDKSNADFRLVITAYEKCEPNPCNPSASLEITVKDGKQEVLVVPMGFDPPQ